MSFGNKLKIAMLISLFKEKGGAQRQCHILSRELTRNGHQVFVITERTKNTPKKEVIDNITVFNVFFLWRLKLLAKSIKRNVGKAISFFRFSKYASNAEERAELDGGIEKNAWYLWPFYKFIWRPITFYIPMLSFMFGALWVFWKKRCEYELVHVHEANHIAIIGLIAAKLFGKKLIIRKATVENYDWNELRRHMLGKIILANIVKADCYAAISEQIEQELKLYQKKSHFIIAPIPNGVEMPFRAAPVAHNNVVTYTGRLSIEKGVDILLHAWSLCHNANGYELIIIGDGPEMSHLKDIALRLPVHTRVTFIGMIHDVAPYLIKTKIFVLPSRLEGMPNALLEAMSFGLPCVATDVSGSVDLVQNGINGLLVERKTPKSLAQAIDYLIQNPQDAMNMGKKARELIETRYDIRIIGKQYVELYRSLLTQARLCPEDNPNEKS